MSQLFRLVDYLNRQELDSHTGERLGLLVDGMRGIHVDDDFFKGPMSVCSVEISTLGN